MAEDGDDYPLNCIDSLSDGFSGWFAITNPRKCNDFCFWNVVDNYNEENDGGGSRYTALNTADPHQTTVVYDAKNSSLAIAYWVCIYDSADDKTLVSQSSGEKWIDTWHEHLDKSTISSLDYFQNDDNMDNVPFPPLRCHKGAGEKLRTIGGDAVQSPAFWQSWIILCSSIIIIQITILYMRCKKRKLRYDRLNILNNESVMIGDLHLDETTETESSNGATLLTEQESMEIEESMIENPTAVDNSPQREIRLHDDTRRFNCTRFMSQNSFILRVLSVLTLNILLVITIAFSSLSLMETKYHVELSDAMEKLTPECTNPNFLCKRGNQEIDKPSAYRSPDADTTFARSETVTTTGKPFSYIIASDSQLHWFNGEFAEMGEKSIPLSCTENDSCGHCTAKHGYNTNLRMKRAWEILMTEGNSSQPIPDTLIMNGDLTAYFHPYQKYAYESIYSDIDGLKHFFPVKKAYYFENVQ